MTDESGASPSDLKFGQGNSVWTMKFNRDMDQKKQPLVTFGPDRPYTDFMIPGDWITREPGEEISSLQRYLVTAGRIFGLQALLPQITLGWLLEMTRSGSGLNS